MCKDSRNCQQVIRQHHAISKQRSAELGSNAHLATVCPCEQQDRRRDRAAYLKPPYPAMECKAGAQDPLAPSQQRQLGVLPCGRSWEPSGEMMPLLQWQVVQLLKSQPSPLHRWHLCLRSSLPVWGHLQEDLHHPRLQAQIGPADLPEDWPELTAELRVLRQLSLQEQQPLYWGLLARLGVWRHTFDKRQHLAERSRHSLRMSSAEHCSRYCQRHPQSLWCLAPQP
mmetsp:Transcript_52266/g.122357  ORF Transcript_52266/g.122357 Transcript_52266/m.122357 type:complete len:226 (-) Transcript_52266:761-1438(-)